MVGGFQDMASGFRRKSPTLNNPLLLKDWLVKKGMREERGTCGKQVPV